MPQYLKNYHNKKYQLNHTKKAQQTNLQKFSVSDNKVKLDTVVMFFTQ